MQAGTALTFLRIYQLMPLHPEHYQTEYDKKLRYYISEHDHEMSFQPAVLLETHIEQRRIRHKKLSGTDECDSRSKAGDGSKLEQCKAVHYAVYHEIKKHRVEKRLG